MTNPTPPPSPPDLTDLPNTSLGDPGSSWRIEKRLHVGWKSEVLTLVGATLVAFALSGILIVAAGINVWDAFKALFQGAAGSRRSILETLVQATPLILTGLAAAVAFRARIWNIGGEGQFFAGAMGTWWVANQFGDALTPVIVLPMMVIAAAIAGAAWASIAGFLRAYFGTNEIIVTVMLNFVILFILSWLLGGPWRSPDTYYFQTIKMPEATWLPRFLADSRLHWGFALALLAAVGVYILLWKTSLGFEIRGLGTNEIAARFKGIDVARTIIVVMAISGALAGLAGLTQVGGIHYRLQLDISTGYGFAGIIIALVGRLHPAGVVIAAIGFGALINGATFMQISTGTPSALVEVIQGLVLILVLVGSVVVRYRVRRVGGDD
ncbi:MAG: ABC transporter permease [Acidimicrobiia bacterium]|nr:MAG: ABC transporter permease [Acidimicrobiia bacterium]